MIFRSSIVVADLNVLFLLLSDAFLFYYFIFTLSLSRTRTHMHMSA